MRVQRGVARDKRRRAHVSLDLWGDVGWVVRVARGKQRGAHVRINLRGMVLIRAFPRVHAWM
jgi:hypothetical protein